jgi:fatty acid desaturase
LGNDIVGQLLLLPLLIPIPVYRKIHKFHHTDNRRDHHTSTLDGKVVDQEPGALVKFWHHLTWYVGVFLGGYFLHGVISILLFLFVPPQLAEKVSPAFEGWTFAEQLTSAAIFAGGVGLHVGFGWVFGVDAWAVALGYPLLFFAWIYSLIVYIYHYRTTYGEKVWLNVRSVEDASALFRWWLLNFNHHRVHHRYPTLPWHMLPEEPAELPEDFADNENVDTIHEAILQQAQGPSIFVEEPTADEQ